MVRPVENPPNPWHTQHAEWLGPPPLARLEVFEEEARSILSEIKSPDVGFRWSVNPYRGCFHGCAYCYARPTHQYLDFGAGTDFERKIVVKVNAPALVRAAFARRSWTGETIHLSGNTDCYQPLEASYELTRGILKVCRDYRNPVALITKNPLVRRDLDVLTGLPSVAVYFSIPFSDNRMARAIEPYAPRPTERFEAMRELARAGIPVGVAVAPLIPGLNESQMPDILRRARDCGASRAFTITLRLPAEVKGIFFSRLTEAYPDRVDKVRNAVLAAHGGKYYDARFGARMHGEGPRWEAVDALFRRTCVRLGLDTERCDLPSTFQRPGAQLSLFGSGSEPPPRAAAARSGAEQRPRVVAAHGTVDGLESGVDRFLLLQIASIGGHRSESGQMSDGVNEDIRSSSWINARRPLTGRKSSSGITSSFPPWERAALFTQPAAMRMRPKASSERPTFSVCQRRDAISRLGVHSTPTLITRPEPEHHAETTPTQSPLRRISRCGPVTLRVSCAKVPPRFWKRRSLPPEV